jgi:hypothetical protein
MKMPELDVMKNNCRSFVPFTSFWVLWMTSAMGGVICIISRQQPSMVRKP